jgi:hypothetical protein
MRQDIIDNNEFRALLRQYWRELPVLLKMRLVRTVYNNKKSLRGTAKYLGISKSTVEHYLKRPTRSLYFKALNQIYNLLREINDVFNDADSASAFPPPHNTSQPFTEDEASNSISEGRING